MTEVAREGRTYEDKGGPVGTAPDPLAGKISWKSLSLTFLALDIFVWCCHFLLIRLAPDISEFWRPFLSTALEPETWHTLLSWQVFSDVIAVSWNRCRFSRFPLTSLSLGSLIFVRLFFLRPASLDILFSPHLILLTRFSFGTIFLVSCCFTLLFWDLFLSNMFHLTPSVLTFPLSWGHCLFSHFFLLTSSYLAKNVEQSPSCTTKYLPKVFPSNTSYYNYNPCTRYFPVLLRTKKRAQSTSQYYFVLQMIAKGTSQYYFVLQLAQKTFQYYTYFVHASMPVLLRTTKLACTKYFPVLLGTTKLAQTNYQYYLVLQRLHKVLPSTTSYYKACAKHFPVLLRTESFAQSTSQYYFVLQSWHKVLPSTTSYYKACKRYFRVPLRTTIKLAQKTSQYYFVHASMPVLLRTTKLACTKYFPVLLRTTKLAQSISQYYFIVKGLHKVLPSTTLY